MGLFYAKAARKVLCEIYKNEMYGKKYVWFFIGWYEDNWFNSEKHLKEENIGCSRQEMEKAAEGHFTTEALQWNSDRYSPTVSGHVSSIFLNGQLKIILLLKKNRRWMTSSLSWNLCCGKATEVLSRASCPKVIWKPLWLTMPFGPWH